MTTPLATTQFNAPPGNSDVLIPLSVRLEPGNYGLIFWAEGLNAGNMPGHDIDIPGRASYFSYLDNFPPFRGWIDGPYTGLRFVVTGRVIPEPATISMLGLALLAMIGCARRGTSCMTKPAHTSQRSQPLTAMIVVGTRR
jgi:hypothetical protein